MREWAEEQIRLGKVPAQAIAYNPAWTARQWERQKMLGLANAHFDSQKQQKP